MRAATGGADVCTRMYCAAGASSSPWRSSLNSEGVIAAAAAMSLPPLLRPHDARLSRAYRLQLSRTNRLPAAMALDRWSRRCLLWARSACTLQRAASIRVPSRNSSSKHCARQPRQPRTAAHRSLTNRSRRRAQPSVGPPNTEARNTVDRSTAARSTARHYLSSGFARRPQEARLGRRWVRQRRRCRPKPCAVSPLGANTALEAALLRAAGTRAVRRRPPSQRRR